MDNRLSGYIKKPIKIGGREVAGRLFLAPMAGLGHMALRELVGSFGGCGLLFTEMCNAKAVPHENRHLSPVFKWRDEELDQLVCQLFGSSPEAMARAAQRIEAEGFFGVDINFGCSAGAICKKNCGAALLKDPDLAESIVRSIRQAVSLPVFVKYRIGWRDDPEFAVAMAKRFEGAGADAIVFHPRVAPDKRHRPPKWEYIGRIKEAVGIPVFGNGNVFDENDLDRILKETGCDGVSLGRVAVAKPWIFALFSGLISQEGDLYQHCAEKMADLLDQHYDPVMALKLYKKFGVYFAANFKFGHNVNKKLIRAENMEELKGIIKEIFENPPEASSRPNMNMFG